MDVLSAIGLYRNHAQDSREKTKPQLKRLAPSEQESNKLAQKIKIFSKKYVGKYIEIFLAFIVIGILIYYSSLFAIDAYVIGDSTMDYLFPTWPAKILVPLGFTIWFLRLFLELVGYFRLSINVDNEPMYVPIIKSAEELANDEINSTRE